MTKAIRMKTDDEYVYPCPYFPIGSIYLTVENINPSTYFGGTWTQITGKFLMGADNNHRAGSTGGSSSHYHTLSSNGYAKLNISYASTKIYQRKIDTAAWNDQSNASISSQAVEQDTGTSSFGVELGGKTDNENNLPPYFAVYIWRRTG